MKLHPHEGYNRSAVKSISYRIISISVDTIVAYFFTKNIYATVGIVILVDSYSTILYYLHERIWAHIKWGIK